ncbi:MAG: hypothetical protein ABSE82_07465 [Nitrososphaerales archaeon]|jgi:hypothetical protein
MDGTNVPVVTIPTSTQNAITAVAPATSANTPGPNISKYQDQYNQYTALAQQYGVTPMSLATFNQEMDSHSADSDPNGAFISSALLPLATQIGQQINSMNTSTSSAMNTPYTAINTAFDVSKWQGMTAGQIIADINNQFSAPYSTAAAAAAKVATPSSIENDPVAQSVMAQLNSIKNAGPGSFTAPSQATETTDVTNWQQQLQAMDAPQEQYQLEQLSNTVNNSYIANNPYSVGSGNQVTATQDAANAMLMATQAQENAQAMTLGVGQYNQDYQQAWANFQNQQSQYNMANASLLNIANTNVGEQNQSWFNQQAAQINANTQTYNAAMNSAITQSNDQWAQIAAQAYQPQSASFYQSLIPAALTAAGTAIAPGVGTAIGAGLGSLFSTPNSGLPSSINPSTPEGYYNPGTGGNSTATSPSTTYYTPGGNYSVFE